MAIHIVLFIFIDYSYLCDLTEELDVVWGAYLFQDLRYIILAPVQK